VDNTKVFNASAGFHLANTGTDRNVVLAERICALEKDRIRVANKPESTRLQSVLETLGRERQQLQLILGATLKAGVSLIAWPIWQTMMTFVFVSAGFAFTRMSFEPFDFNPELLWPCCIGLAFLCAYGTAEFLEKTNLKIVVLGLSIVLFVSSIAGLATLASVRGDIFLHQLQVLTDPADASATTAPDNALAFYATAGPKMRLFLILLSLSLELAAGLALHEVRQTLKARRLQQPSPEKRRLEIVEQEIGQTEAQLAFLRNEPEVFENEYRRNVLIGLLAGAARHAQSSANWPTKLAVVALLGLGSTLHGQAIDIWEGLDLSATSKATGYDGKMAHSQNVEAAARTIATLPPGSRITVAAISDDSFARPLVLLTGRVPDGPGKLREYDQVAARNRLAGSLRRIGASVEPRFQSTDILGFLIVAGMAFQKTPAMRHVLLIHSDMRQSAAPLDIEHVHVVPVAASLSAVERRHLFADLSGVEVYVSGAHAVGKDIAYWQSLRDFWTAYFERCHATLRGFSIMRDTPDLTGAR
jgi:hypothetical protein